MKRAELSELARAAAMPVPAVRDGPVRLSCVVPAWNEAEDLGELLLQLEAVLPACAHEWEIVLVDDGSTDGTQGLFESWEQRPGLRMLTLSRNFGKEAALMAGLQAARGDVVITMDADLQHPPSLIERFVAQWRAGADVVYAVRSGRRDEPRFKRWGTRLFYRLLNAADRFDVPEDAGDFRLMDRRVVDALLALPERNRFMKGLYAWVGFRSVAVPYEAAPRQHGASHFGPRQLLKLSLVGLTAFTTWPLRAVSYGGIVLALLAFAYGLFLIVDYLLFGHQVSGWTTIVVGLMFLSGVQMVSLGVVGEYVGRIFEEVKGRPLYLVQRERGTGLAVPPLR